MNSETQNILTAALRLVSKDFEVNECGANFDRNFILTSEAMHGMTMGQKSFWYRIQTIFYVTSSLICEIYLILIFGYEFSGGAIRNTSNSRFVVCFPPGGCAASSIKQKL